MVKRIKKFKPTLAELNNILSDMGVERHDAMGPITKAHCETYGPKTMAYLAVGDMSTRREIETKLARLGIYTNPNYCTRAGNCATDSPRLEIQVRYFRAFGWNA